MMRAAVIQFPGSNCDRDMAVAIRDITGADTSLVWHRESVLPSGLDLIAIPGGFSYGDYLRSGAMAARSPVMQAVIAAAGRGVPVLGVCNGFQILTEAGLLPGAVMRNAGIRFVCRDVALTVENAQSLFTAGYTAGQQITIPVAHHDGNYFADADTLDQLENEGRVAFRYADTVNGSARAIAGVLNDAGTVRGRAVVTQQTRKYFYDVAERRDQIYYGALDFDLSPDTTLGLGMAYEDVDATPCWGGLPRYKDGSDLKLGRSTCLDPSWNTWRSQRTTVFSDLAHQLNDNWALKVASVYTKNTQDIKYAFASGAVSTGVGTTGMLGSMYDYDQVDYGLDAYVDGKFDAFGRQHELVVGANASRGKKDDFYSVAFLPQRQNVFNPNKHIPEPDDSYFIANSSRGGPVNSLTKQKGLYSILRLKLADPLTLVGGTRVSWYSSDTDYDFINSGTSEHASTKETGQVTPFAGVLLDLNENLTAYASYSDIFTPQGNYRAEDGSTLKPLVGQSYELGIKGAWYDGRLNGAFNLFRNTEEGRAEADYNSVCTASSDGYCYTDSGKVRAQGFEAELSGELIERLQVLAGYTYTQVEYLKRVDENRQDATFSASYVPKHMARVWTNYDLDGALQRWSIGGGVSAQSANHYVDRGSKVMQPGYALWSARIGSRVDEHWTLALNGNNLFDKHYYSSVGAINWGNFYGEPRNLMLTLQGDF